MRAVLGLTFAVFAGVGVFVVVMQPTPSDRLVMGLTFALMAGLTLAAAAVLPRVARVNRSVRTTVLAVSLVSSLILVLGLLAAGQLMFVSPHDLTLLLIVIGFGAVAAITFAFLVSGPLTGELGRISTTAAAIAAGDLSMRTTTTRADEVGKLAAAIDEMAEALQQAERRRAHDDGARRRLFAAIGHDLRTPLSALQAAIEAVQDGVAEDPDRYLEAMRRDTQALASLVDRLFLLARLESGDLVQELEPLDLTEVADEAIESILPLCEERGLEITMNMDHRVTAVASADGMARVVRNLLENAVRHSPTGGRIVVSVSNGEFARMEISDQGEGFSPDFLDRAFDRSTRDSDDRSRSSGGAGLGLAIARSYVESFGGRIWAEPGPGGKVAFTIPIAG